MTVTTATANYPQVAVNDIGTAEELLAAIDATIKYFNDGDIVSGTIVKVDRDQREACDSCLSSSLSPSAQPPHSKPILG